MAEFMTDEQFMGRASSASAASKSSFMSDEEFLGASTTPEQEEEVARYNLPGKFEEKYSRPAIEKSKEEIREALKNGAFNTRLRANEEGQIIEEKSPAQRVAESVLLPPYSGLRGGVEAGASFISELPRAIGMGAGAIGGGLGGAVSPRGSIAEGAVEGATTGAELVKKHVPALPTLTPQGATARGLLEVFIETAEELLKENAPNLNKLNPLYHALPQEYKDQADAIMAGAGATAGNILAPWMIAKGLTPARKPGLQESLDKLNELKQNKPDLEPRKAQPPSEPLKYLSDAEFFTKEAGETPYRQDLGEPITRSRRDLINFEDSINQTQEGIIEVPKTTRDAIMEQSNTPVLRPVAEEGIVTPKRQPGVVEPVSPDYAPSMIEKTQEGVLRQPIERSPYELSGKPGTEGLNPETSVLRSFNPLEEFYRKFGSDTHPFDEIKAIRREIGKEVEQLEKYSQEARNLAKRDPAKSAAMEGLVRSSHEKINKLTEQFEPVLQAYELTKGTKGTKLESFNPVNAFYDFAERIKQTRLPNGNPVTVMVSKAPFDYDAKTPFKDPITRQGINLVHGEFRPNVDFTMIVRDANGNMIGHAEFKNHKTGWVEARNLVVDEGSRNQKVMTTMYDQVKKMGYKVMRSPYQTGDGRMAWNKHGIAWSFNPMEALTKIAGKSEKSFERKLVEQYGEEIRPYVKSLYANAKQEKQAEKGSSVSKTKGEEGQEVLRTEVSENSAAERVVELGGWDKRSGEQVKAEMLSDSSTIKDLPDGKMESLGRLLQQGQSYAKNHPIMNWVYSKLDLVERDINRITNEIMYGENYVERNFTPVVLNKTFPYYHGSRISSLRRAVREADPDSMMYKYNKLKDVDKENVRRVGDKFNGVKEPTEMDLRAEGLKQTEIEAYQNLRKGLDKFWDDVMVPMAQKLGIELPAKIPGYFPMSWFGDYRVWGKNRETGKYDIARGVNNIREAEAIIKEMTQKYPQYEFLREDVTNIHKEFTSTPEAFLDAIKLFGRNSETGKQLYEAMSEIQLRMGASKHRLARNTERTQGYAGSLDEGRVLNPFNTKEFGRQKQLVNFERSLENYIETGVRYAKNKEVMSDMDVALKDPKMVEKFPNAIGLGENLRASFLGEEKFLDASLNKAMQALGQSSNLPREVLSSIAGMVMFTKVMGLRVPFYVAQALQDVFVLPRLSQLKGKGVDGSINEAVLKGTTDWLNGANRVEDIRWAVKNGVVDPKFAEQITFIPSIRGKKVNTKDVINTLTGNRLSAAIDQSIRLKSFLTFMNFLESAGIKGQQAREIAARNSLDIMVEYESWKRSPMFREMGTMGGAVSPLTTFTNNLLNRLTEYAKDAGKGKAAPIAAIAGIYLFLSGLYGFPFRQDIDNGIDLLNNMFDSDMPTVTDFLIKHSDTLGDVGLFGVPSGMTGMQIGGSLGSPEIIGSLVPALGDPVPQFVGQNAKAAYTAATKRGNMTDAEKMALLKAPAPTAPGHGMIENYFSPSNRPRSAQGALPQNQPVTIPQPNMEGGYTRSPAEQIARLFGMRSTQEATDQIKRYRVEAKEERMERRRTRALDNVVDGISSGKGIGEDSIKRYIENGGDPKELLTSVENKVERRLLDARTRTLDSLTRGDLDNSTFRKVKLLEEFKLYLGDSRK